MALTALLDVLVHALMRVGAAHQQRRRTAKAAAAQDESSGSDKDLELACMAEAPVLACISEAPMLRQCHASEEIEPGSQAAEVAAVLQSDPHTADLLRMGEPRRGRRGRWRLGSKAATAAVWLPRSAGPLVLRNAPPPCPPPSLAMPCKASSRVWQLRCTTFPRV